MNGLQRRRHNILEASIVISVSGEARRIFTMRNTRATEILSSAFLGIFGPEVALPEEGWTVFYSDVFQGQPTASREIFDQSGMTAAHKTLRFGTRIRVTNLENNNSVVLTVNDRIARQNSNILDVTRRAAQGLGFEDQGRARVSIEPAP
tara:strand:- start:5286 stop:5732 length:447 start_codon:yes stop_codon:yes gene_type:complete